jgi:hypothetical protein
VAKFSQRYGHTPLVPAFQREAIDELLRTKLWNLLKVGIWDRYEKTEYHYPELSQRIEALVRRLWFHFFNRDLDGLPEFRSHYGDKAAYDLLKHFFFSCNWFEVYDFLEEISTDQSRVLDTKLREWINQELETHNAAYRFVGETIVEIMDENEIAAIEDGLSHSDAPVREHLAAAVRMLSDREAPDYRNAVKQAISAIEAACRLLTGQPAATLGDASRKISNIHPAFARAFSQLYGYTSDASGIRHSLTDEPDVSYADAKFMVVACAAFVSYLKASAGDA